MIKRQIFIGGCSRSGTTLLGSMLGAHSDCITTPESHFKTSVLRGRSADIFNLDSKEALSKISRQWRFKVWDVKIDSTHFDEASKNKISAKQRRGNAKRIYTDYKQNKFTRIKEKRN